MEDVMKRKPRMDAHGLLLVWWVVVAVVLLLSMPLLGVIFGFQEQVPLFKSIAKLLSLLLDF
jgi:hypothetical protein